MYVARCLTVALAWLIAANSAIEQASGIVTAHHRKSTGVDMVDVLKHLFQFFKCRLHNEHVIRKRGHKAVHNVRVQGNVNTHKKCMEALFHQCRALLLCGGVATPEQGGRARIERRANVRVVQTRPEAKQRGSLEV